MNVAECTAPVAPVSATGEALDKLAKFVDVSNEVARAVHASEASQTHVLTNGRLILPNGDILVIRNSNPVGVLDRETMIAYEPVIAKSGEVSRGARIPTFDDFNDAMQARIRKRAADMRRAQHKPYHAIIRFASKVPGFDEAFSRPFMTRGEALKYIRQMRGNYPHDIEFVNIAYMG